MSAVAAAFYFDLASPTAYLASEQILHALGGPAEWRPVLARDLQSSAPAEASSAEDAPGGLRTTVAERARALGLQPLRWPDPFPFDSSLAMRVATYAKSIGRTVPFAQAAFRQAYAGGHSLESMDFVLIAAAACEMHPSAVVAGAEMRSVAAQLAAATADAAAAGVRKVPAIAVGERVFHGERCVAQAAVQLTQTSGARA